MVVGQNLRYLFSRDYHGAVRGFDRPIAIYLLGQGSFFFERKFLS